LRQRIPPAPAINATKRLRATGTKISHKALVEHASIVGAAPQVVAWVCRHRGLTASQQQQHTGRQQCKYCGRKTLHHTCTNDSSVRRTNNVFHHPRIVLD
jgi:hypothetical protein